MEDFVYKNETYQIIGICMEVQGILGFGFSESIYKDAMEAEFITIELPYAREKELEVEYKGKILKHKFFADYVCYEKIIIEVKSTDKGITDDYVAQTLNYLRVSGNAVALIINFGKRRLEYKRLILS
jgi:GxxExxY protein